MLAADPLMRDRGDLAGQALQRRLVEFRRVVPLDLAAGRLDPELARFVHIDVGDVRPRQHARQRRQIGAKIDARAVIGGGAAHRRVSAPVKSRSRATKIEMLVPARTVRVGVIWAGWTIWVAPCSVPGSTTTAPLLLPTRPARLTPTSRIDCRIAPAKRARKCEWTSAWMPPPPSGSAAGEPIAMVTPSGRISRGQLTKA